jgi:hypothetical protein
VCSCSPCHMQHGGHAIGVSHIPLALAHEPCTLKCMAPILLLLQSSKCNCDCMLEVLMMLKILMSSFLIELSLMQCKPPSSKWQHTLIGAFRQGWSCAINTFDSVQTMHIFCLKFQGLAQAGKANNRPETCKERKKVCE